MQRLKEAGLVLAALWDSMSLCPVHPCVQGVPRDLTNRRSAKHPALSVVQDFTIRFQLKPIVQPALLVITALRVPPRYRRVALGVMRQAHLLYA